MYNVDPEGFFSVSPSEYRIQNSLGETEEPLRIVGNAAEIRTRHFLSYLTTLFQLLGAKWER
jgi:hypothetical protein